MLCSLQPHRRVELARRVRVTRTLISFFLSENGTCCVSSLLEAAALPAGTPRSASCCTRAAATATAATTRGVTAQATAGTARATATAGVPPWFFNPHAGAEWMILYGHTALNLVLCTSNIQACARLHMRACAACLPTHAHECATQALWQLLGGAWQQRLPQRRLPRLPRVSCTKAEWVI